MKIYPSFYLLIFVGVAQGWRVPWRKLLAELFFYQNYVTGLWSHTWSLAVEEHFYLTLPLLLVFLVRQRQTESPNPSAPSRNYSSSSVCSPSRRGC